MKTLDAWELFSYQDGNQMRLRLKGIVSGHPRFSNGTEIITSYVDKIENNIAFTHSGSEYQLKDSKWSIH